jgi:hypothetical protein
MLEREPFERGLVRDRDPGEVINAANRTRVDVVLPKELLIIRDVAGCVLD